MRVKLGYEWGFPIRYFGTSRA